MPNPDLTLVDAFAADSFREASMFDILEEGVLLLVVLLEEGLKAEGGGALGEVLSWSLFRRGMYLLIDRC
jgi:hypothetical protein